jgi:hypothetical protein
MVVNLLIMVVWVVTSCGLVGDYLVTSYKTRWHHNPANYDEQHKSYYKYVTTSLYKGLRCYVENQSVNQSIGQAVI